MYRIMVIEDDLQMADALKKQIEPWGNEVMCVRDFQAVIFELFGYHRHLLSLATMLSSDLG